MLQAKSVAGTAQKAESAVCDSVLARASMWPRHDPSVFHDRGTFHTFTDAAHVYIVG